MTNPDPTSAARRAADRRPRMTAGLAFLGVSALVLIQVTNFGRADLWIGEGGIVETLSFGLWAISALVCLMAAVRAKRARLAWLLGGLVVAILCARELDIQKAFFDWNAGKPANYLDSEIPFGERALVFAVFVAPALCVLGGFALVMARRFLAAWRAGEIWPRDFVIWLALIVPITLLDKFHKYAGGLGVAESHFWIATTLEECLELSLALYVLLVILRAWRRDVLGRTP
ncbi:MAG: hypothetical protein AAF495_24005 [Pseudomonadota bacterium]